MAHEYKMLRCRDEIYLSKEVTKHLADEWELWGNPFMISMDMENGWFCQAVVRFDPASATHVAETAEGVLMTPRLAGHSVVGKVETAAGYTVQVPETPGGGEGRAQDMPTFEGVPCGCFEIVGDNPNCAVHSGGPIKSGRVY